MQLIFGIGALWGNRTDASGIGPDQFAILQENTIDFSFEQKELYGQLQFPVDIARGKGKITGKAKSARVFAALYADLFFGTLASTGETNTAENESHNIPATGAFTLFVSNTTGYVADLGVFYGSGANSGNKFSYVSASASVSTAGQYYQNGAGEYVFSSGDASANVLISYNYTDTSGFTIQLTNNFMGFTPTFAATFYQQRTTQGSTGQLTLRLLECVSSHLTLPSKLDDYGIPDLDFMAFANGANQIGTLSTSQ